MGALTWARVERWWMKVEREMTQTARTATEDAIERHAVDTADGAGTGTMAGATVDIENKGFGSGRRGLGNGFLLLKGAW